MNKSQRKQIQGYERDEESRHSYKIQKKLQDKKLMRNLDKALRNKDYVKLVRSEDY